MKAIRSKIIGLLAVAVMGAFTLGITACSGVEVNPNGSGGVIITPTTGDSNDSSTDKESGDSSSSVQDSEDHTHDWKQGAVVIEATCTASGVISYNCDCGDTKLEVVDALGHDCIRYGAQAPTCETVGWSDYEKCDRDGCNYTTYSELAALGHDSIFYGAKEATCTEHGWDAYEVCQRCAKNTYKVIPALGHSYDNGVCTRCHIYEPSEPHTCVWDAGEVTTPATCTSNGITTYTCTICEDKKTESIAAPGHDSVQYAAQAPTCEVGGWEAYEVCKKCNYSTRVDIPAPGHSYSNISVDTAASCTTDGVRKYACTCGKYYTETIPAFGHEYGDWKVVKNPDCETNGEEQQVCKYDSTHVVSKSIAKTGHNYGAWKEVKGATCAVEGEEQRVCANNASHVETRSIPKTDAHSMGKDGRCEVCGKTLKDQHHKPHVCPRGDEGEDYLWADWDDEDGVDHYRIKINGDVQGTIIEESEVFLEDYFDLVSDARSTNPILNVQVKAIAAADSDYVDSEWSDVLEYEIPGESIIQSGIGRSMNLLKGTYEEGLMGLSGSGSICIFDEAKLNRVRIYETNPSYTTVNEVFAKGYTEYLEENSEEMSSKTAIEAGLDLSVIKLTGGLEVSTGNNYKKASQSKTETVFYDLNYYNAAVLKEIYGYKDADNKLSTMLSADFLAAAQKVQNGEMSAAQFVNLYGTHVVVAGIYGSKVTAHYEMVGYSSAVSENFGDNAEATVKGAFEYALKFDASVSASGSMNAINNTNASNMYSTLSIVGRGMGDNVYFTSMEDLKNNYNTWSQNAINAGNALIDVPDNSLYCVWDLLGDEYATAKAILNAYFTQEANAQYAELESKLAARYTDVMTLTDSGILTIDLSGLQTINTSNTSIDIREKISYDGFDTNTGVFEISSSYPYKMVHGEEGEPIVVQRIILKGNYFNTDDYGNLILSEFSNLSFNFGSAWAGRNIIIELDHISFRAGSASGGLSTQAANESPAFNFNNSSAAEVNILCNNYATVHAGWNNVGIQASDINALYFGGSGTVAVYGENGCQALLAKNRTAKTEGYVYGTNIYLSPISKAEHIMQGWFLDSGCTTLADGNLKLGETYLYAKWEKYSYTLKYSVDDKTSWIVNGAATSVWSEKVYFHENEVIISTVPTKTGYIFKGWIEVDGNGNAINGKIYAAGEVVNDLSNVNWATVNLVPEWELITSKTVTFEDFSVGLTTYNANSAGTVKGFKISDYFDTETVCTSQYNFKLTISCTLNQGSHWINYYSEMYRCNPATTSNFADYHLITGDTNEWVGDPQQRTWTFDSRANTAHSAELLITNYVAFGFQFVKGTIATSSSATCAVQGLTFTLEFFKA